MTQDRDFRDYLQDILDAIGKIERFTSGMSLEEFSAEDKTALAQCAVLTARRTKAPAVGRASGSVTANGSACGRGLSP